MKSLKIIKWVLFTIAYGYSLMNVIIFVIALLFNCINWGSESLVADLLKMLLCLLVVVLWHIDLNLDDHYERSLKDSNRENDNKYNHIVHLQNRIDESTNFEHLIVNKKVSMFYIGLSATHVRYNEYVSFEDQKLSREEFHLIKNVYHELIEVK